MDYLIGVDYDYLCGECQVVIDQCLPLMADVTDDYQSDNEGPLMLAGDHGLLCGGRECKNHVGKVERTEIDIGVVEFDDSLNVISRQYHSAAIISIGEDHDFKAIEFVESLLNGYRYREDKNTLTLCLWADIDEYRTIEFRFFKG